LCPDLPSERSEQGGLATNQAEIRQFNAVIAGVGGQGNILASEIFAAAAVKAGYKVRVGETFGAAQRGGPVASYVRLGSSVFSPIVSPRSVHLIVGFEPVEALRNASKFMAPKGVVVLNTRPIIPTSVSMGKDRYPSTHEIVKAMEKLGASKVVAFDATEMAEKLGNPIIMNMVMLGALAGTGILPFDAEVIRETMKERIPGALLEINLRAFDAGFDAVREKS